MKINLATANDNRPSLDVDFQLPELFVNAYNQELLAWAGALQERGPLLTIDLWNPPGATILSPGYQGSLTLRCDVLASAEENAMLFVIQAEGPENYEKLRLHCEALPKIMAAHRARAEALKGAPRGAIRAEFNLPEYFVHRYGLELREWGRNFARIGPVKTIVLREGTLSDMSPAEDQGAVLRGVKLKAKIERLKNDEMLIVISPDSEQDERIVRNHVQKMTQAGISAIASLVEPPRPGMPFMPNIAGAKGHADGGI